MSGDKWNEVRKDFARIRYRYGLASVAYALGTSKSSVDRWAKGIATPQPTHAARIRAMVEHWERRRSQVGSGQQSNAPNPP